MYTTFPPITPNYPWGCFVQRHSNSAEVRVCRTSTHTHVSTFLPPSSLPLLSPLPSTLSQILVQKPIFVPGSTMFNNMAFLSFPLMYVTPCCTIPKLDFSQFTATTQEVEIFKVCSLYHSFSFYSLPLRRTYRWSQIANRTKKLEKAGTSPCCWRKGNEKAGARCGGRGGSVLFLICVAQTRCSLAFAFPHWLPPSLTTHRLKSGRTRGGRCGGGLGGMRHHIYHSWGPREVVHSVCFCGRFHGHRGHRLSRWRGQTDQGHR